MSRRRGTAAYGAASRSSTVTGKRYECSPYELEIYRSRLCSWTKSTPLGDSFRFLENIGLFLSVPEQVTSAPSYMVSNLLGVSA